MIARFSLFFLFLSLNILSAEPPAKGTYVFIKNFEIEGCVKHLGGRGIDGGRCLETAKKIYKAGDKIIVDEFFFDDKDNTFGAKVVVFDQFRRVPLEFIRFVP